jgi:SAM-dependent methyltransferase
LSATKKLVRRKTDRKSQRVFINAGCGTPRSSSIPVFFKGWREIRVDVDPAAKPDVLASIVDLSAIPDATVDAVWSAHCIEHLYAHEVPVALAEFRRVLRTPGFACVITPDLQAVAEWLLHDRIHECLYESASGPITAHDVIWGFGRAIASGKRAMAHHCGFTPTPLIQRLNEAGFAEIMLRRRSGLELVALALTNETLHPRERETLMAELGF